MPRYSSPRPVLFSRRRWLSATAAAGGLAALAGPGTTTIDTRGLTATPGFIDAHSHPLMANEAVSVNVDFRSIGEVQEALRAKAAATPPGHWVQGHMYDDTKFVEGRAINRDDLDAVSTAHPVFIRHRGGRLHRPHRRACA